MLNITGQDLVNKIKNQTGLSKIRAADVIKKAGLTDVSAYPARALSQAQQQKLLKNLPAAIKQSGYKVRGLGDEYRFKQKLKKNLSADKSAPASKKELGVDWLQAKVLKPAAEARTAAKSKVATTINTDKPQVSISDKNTRQASISVFDAKPVQTETKAEKPSRPAVELAI